mmetsp:Transcript_26197/g.39996  ORF Transcript_26197/g.39996 Transcript_26197/m.39996 type:complete len:117 (-) Transcript_26197:691-1041(-)
MEVPRDIIRGPHKKHPPVEQEMDMTTANELQKMRSELEHLNHASEVDQKPKDILASYTVSVGATDLEAKTIPTSLPPPECQPEESIPDAEVDDLKEKVETPPDEEPIMEENDEFTS